MRLKDADGIWNNVDLDPTAEFDCTICSDMSVRIQSKFSGSNTFGSIKISSRQG